MAFSKHISTLLFDQFASGIIVCNGDDVEYINQACSHWLNGPPVEWPVSCGALFSKMALPLREALEMGMQRECFRTTLLLPPTDDEPQPAVKIETNRLTDDQAPVRIIMLTDETLAHQNQQQLQKALKMADLASKAKTDFLATMSHEIRTPLNSIIGFTSLLLDTEMPAATRGYLDAIYKSGESLLMLVNDMLDLSRLNGGTILFRPRAINLQDFLSEIDRETRPRTLEKKLAWHVHLNSNLPKHVVADETRLHQVINNLISNSIKFTLQGSVSLAVAFHYNTPTTGCLEIKITDTGIGIPEEHHDRIFDVFNQVNNNTDRPFEGIGLGLSITRRLVTLMKGTISISSKPGSGSIFIVTLPDISTKSEQESEPGTTITLSAEKPPVQQTVAEPIHIGLPAEWLPDVQRARKVFLYNDVEELCRKIDELGARAHHRALSGLTAQLRAAANDFNIEEADALLQQIEQLIQKPTI